MITKRKKGEEKKMMCVWWWWWEGWWWCRWGWGEWDRTQQVGRIIFGENMKLLMEALEGEYLLTLSGESFVMLPVCN